jgi:hypothetical protein
MEKRTIILIPSPLRGNDIQMHLIPDLSELMTFLLMGIETVREGLQVSKREVGQFNAACKYLIL